MENIEKKEPKEIDLVKLLKTVWSHRLKMFIWGAVGLVVAIVVIISTPNEYQGSVKIVTESKSQSSSGGSLGGIAAMMGVSVGDGKSGVTEAVYPQILKSAPFLHEFNDIEVEYKGVKMTLFKYVTEEIKYPWWTSAMGLPGAIFSSSSDEKTESSANKEESNIYFNPDGKQRQFEGVLSSRISATQDKKAGVYEITARMQDPVVAAIVADSVVSKLGRYMINYHTSKTRNDLEMNLKMLEKAKVDYINISELCALAKDNNRGNISSAVQARLDRLDKEQNIALDVYQQLANQVEACKINVQDATPVSTIIEPSRVPEKPISPNKKIIIIGLVFFGMFIFAAKEVVKELMNSEKQDESLNDNQDKIV